MEVAAAAIGLLEATFRIINRLKKAYGRMKDAPQILEKYSNELKTIKTIIEVVDDEQSLQTANVHSEVEKVKKIEGRLKDCLKTAEKNSKESVKPMAQFSHQLFKGSNDEKKISEIMMELGSVKATLCLHIQLSSVGVMRDMENKLVAKLDVIEHVNQTLVELLGQTGGLRIKGLLENRTARGKLCDLGFVRRSVLRQTHR